MVKRRNSHYAPHDRSAKTRVLIDTTPTTLTPRSPTPRTRPSHTSSRLWSLGNPCGKFF